MAWKEASIMDLRKEFVSLANQADANIRELCHRFQISPTTGYKWLERYRKDSQESFQDRSRRPHHCPLRCEAAMEQQALAVRQQHPAWGARKIRARLHTLGVGEVPAVSTVHAILKRHQRIDPAESAKHKAWQRFEHEAPNQLWQMDFKGPPPAAEDAASPFPRGTKGTLFLSKCTAPDHRLEPLVWPDPDL